MPDMITLTSQTSSTNFEELKRLRMSRSIYHDSKERKTLRLLRCNQERKVVDELLTIKQPEIENEVMEISFMVIRVKKIIDVYNRFHVSDTELGMI